MQAQIQSWPRAPRISVVLRGSDGAAGLRASIESVSRQVYPNWELIVVEDATRDFLDSRIRFVAKDAPIQAAIASAMGAFVCGLSSLLFVLLAEQWRLFRPHHAGAVPLGHGGI